MKILIKGKQSVGKSTVANLIVKFLGVQNVIWKELSWSNIGEVTRDMESAKELGTHLMYEWDTANQSSIFLEDQMDIILGIDKKINIETIKEIKSKILIPYIK